MNTKSKIITILLIIIIVIGAIAFNLNKPKGQLTFGLIAGMTGDYAIVGESFARGAELAQSEWNANHPNQQIAVIKEDDGFDAKKGLSAYKKLSSIDHIDGLINMTTISIDALYSDVTTSGIPVALGFEQGIEAKNDNIVQLWPGTVPAEVELGKYIKSKGYKNVVMVVYDGSGSFIRFANGFKDGYSLPLEEIKISDAVVNIKSSALKVISLKPDAIVMITRSTIGALLVKEIKQLSKENYQFVFDANVQTGFSDYQKVLGDMNVLNGSILYTVPNIYRNEFNNSFKNKFVTDPAIGSETGYNAFMLLAQSYDTDKTKWVENMKHSSFTGADGKIVFDENGVRIPELKIGTIEDGKLPN